MQPVTIALIAATVLLVVWLGIRYGLPWLIDRDDNVPSDAVRATDILGRVGDQGSLRTDSWQLEPSHRAPTEPYTLQQAHRIMQLHIDCGTDQCRAKYSAYWRIVDLGHANPAPEMLR